MSLGIQNTNVSALFGSLNSSSSSNSNQTTGLSSFLSDYASIKNGSYAKLAKQYYAKTSGKKNDVTGSFSEDTQDTIRTNKSLMSEAGSLRSAISALSSDDSLFTEKVKKKGEDGKETEELDYDKIYKKVSAFVDSYNSVIKSGGDSDDTTVLRNTLNMTKMTGKMESRLQDAGITLNPDNTLSVDKEDIKSADMNAMKSLFGTSGTYTRSIDMYATNVASQSAQNIYSLGGYNSSGAYKQALEGIYNAQV